MVSSASTCMVGVDKPGRTAIRSAYTFRPADRPVCASRSHPSSRGGDRGIYEADCSLSSRDGWFSLPLLAQDAAQMPNRCASNPALTDIASVSLMERLGRRRRQHPLSSRRLPRD